jgi:hypothetical protein
LNASDWAFIDQFWVSEVIAKQALFQAAMGNLGPDVNKSLSLNWKSQEEQLKQVVAKFLKDEIECLHGGSHHLL